MLNTRIAGGDVPATEAVASYLARCSPPGRPAREVVVLAGTESVQGVDQAALAAAAAGGRTGLVIDAGALLALGPGSPLAAAAGVSGAPAAPPRPLRLSPGPAGAEVMARLADLGEPRSAVVALAPAEGVEVLLTAPVALDRPAVATHNPDTGVVTLGLDAAALVAGPDDSGLRLLHRLVLRVGSPRPEPAGPLRAGLLGFGAIGAEHLAGFASAGIAVTAVCDRSPDRLEALRSEGVRALTNADDLLDDTDVDLVVVSTPPDTHAQWALAALAAGKHVIVEKPLALGAGDADKMLDTAAAAGLMLGVYQNRRFDPDFVALQRLVAGGNLGQVFHLEAFVGGHDHPCNYWHSDASVSGGTGFDWGSHYLDQILALVPTPVEWVRGSAHKLAWHDVTNDDHVRIEIRFADGTEAEFVHSDLAAALKPKWYVLGTEGAAVGEWRRERVVTRSPVGTLVEDPLAPADSPAVMWLHHPDGSRTELALPVTAPGRYHREVADLLLLGEPMTASAEQSRDVVAVLEAASRSAERGGRPEPCALRSR